MSVVRPAPSLPLCRPAGRDRPTDRRGGGRRRSEPILVPKLRIRLADFPYPHCSIGQRLLTSETCCGRGYDRRDEPCRTPPPAKGGGDEPGPADFQGSSGAHRTPHQRRRSAGPSGLSPVGPLPGPTRPRQRETTTLAGAPADVSGGPSQSRRRRGTGSVPSVREYRPDSLSPRRRHTGMRGSGSTHPRAIAVDAEPSSTSAFQGLVRIVATTTKIGTGGRSGPARARTFSTATAAPSYSQPRENFSAERGWGCGGAWVRRLSALHFQGRSLRQVSCYTLLGGCRLPWPPSCCLERSTPFVGSDERRLGHLSPAFGSSRIASSAYQKWPTEHRSHCPAAPQMISSWCAAFADSKFENASRWNVRPEEERTIIGFTRRNCSDRVPAILREISEGTSY